MDPSETQLATEALAAEALAGGELDHTRDKGTARIPSASMYSRLPG